MTRTASRLTLLLASLLTGSVLSGAALAAEPTGTLKKIADSGQITLGIRESSIPFSYLDDNQKPVGYAVDICNKVVDAVRKQLNQPGIKVVLQPVNSTNRIPLIQNGTIDVECASTSNLEERHKVASFSVSHFVSNIKPMVRVDSGITSLAQLDGKSIALINGMTAVPVLQKFMTDRGLNFNRIFGKDVAEAFYLFKDGRAQAFVFDDVLLAAMAANTGNAKDFRMLDDTLRTEPNALLLRKDDPEFKKLVDDTLIGMMKSGELQSLYARWFTQPIPPKNINLNLPMSPELIEAFRNPSDKGV